MYFSFFLERHIKHSLHTNKHSYSPFQGVTHQTYLVFPHTSHTRSSAGDCESCTPCTITNTHIFLFFLERHIKHSLHTNKHSYSLFQGVPHQTHLVFRRLCPTHLTLDHQRVIAKAALLAHPAAGVALVRRFPHACFGICNTHK